MPDRTARAADPGVEGRLGMPGPVAEPGRPNEECGRNVQPTKAKLRSKVSAITATKTASSFAAAPGASSPNRLLSRVRSFM